MGRLPNAEAFSLYNWSGMNHKRFPTAERCSFFRGLLRVKRVRANEFFTHIQEKKDVSEKYRSSKFILGVQNELVKFDYDTTPKKMGAFASLFKPSYRSSQERKERVMQNISVENASWIGSLLNDLSDEQLRDANAVANEH